MNKRLYRVQKNGTIRIPSYLQYKYQIEAGDGIDIEEKQFGTSANGALIIKIYSKSDDTKPYRVQKNGTIRIPSYLQYKYQIEAGDNINIKDIQLIGTKRTLIIDIYSKETDIDDFESLEEKISA